MDSLLLVVKSMRPRQLPKNLFVFLPMLFTIRQYWRPFTPTMWEFLALSTAAFLLFCLTSGVVYLINDLVDVDKDRAHPRKRLRPIASGALGVSTARVAIAIVLVIAVLGAIALDLYSSSRLSPTASSIFPFPFPFTVITVSYLLLQVAYSFALKNVVILDVFSIAAGFVLRTVAGAAVIQVPISPWLYVLMTMGSLFIGFSKRRNELVVLEGQAANHRAILKEYTPELLDEMISVTTASTVIAYSLYTFTAENLPRNHSMMLTIPFMLYGIFRYLYLIHIKNEGGSPEELLLRDRPLLISVVLWAIAVAAILYVFGRSS